jgi:cobalamin transport system substrate-binding protein
MPLRDESKLLLFAPNLNEAAYVLGYAGRIVAVTDYCIWPAELLERPRLGGILNPNLERIAAFDPGLLVLQGENATLRNFAQREGIAVANVNMDGDLESIFHGILRLDEILGGPKSSRGATVVDSLGRRLDALRVSADGASRPSVLLILGHEPGRLEKLLVVGPGSYLQDLVRLVGGAPVPDDGPTYRNLSLEALVARPPDLAIDLRPGAAASKADEDEFEAAWRALSIDDTRTAIVNFDGILIPGPRVDQSAAVLREVLFRSSRDRP